MVKNPKKSFDGFSEKQYLQAENKEAFLRKHIDINVAEQNLLKQRIEEAKKALFLREKKDPENALFHMQIDRDQIALDELIKVEKNAVFLLEKLEKEPKKSSDH